MIALFTRYFTYILVLVETYLMCDQLLDELQKVDWLRVPQGCSATSLQNNNQGPVVQSVSSLKVISLTVLADSIYSTLILFAEKM